MNLRSSVPSLSKLFEYLSLSCKLDLTNLWINLNFLKKKKLKKKSLYANKFQLLLICLGTKERLLGSTFWKEAPRSPSYSF